jgi:hypothetical protein
VGAEEIAVLGGETEHLISYNVLRFARLPDFVG